MQCVSRALQSGAARFARSSHARDAAADGLAPSAVFWERLASVALLGQSGSQQHAFSTPTTAGIFSQVTAGCGPDPRSATQHRNFAIKRLARATQLRRSTIIQEEPATTAQATDGAAAALDEELEISEEEEEEEEEDQEESEDWEADTSITELQEGDINTLYEFRHDLVPEAFQKYYDEAYDRNDTVIDRGGCKGLEAELFGAVAAEKQDEEDRVPLDDHRLLYRQLTHQLKAVVLGRSRPQLMLDGPVGSGKSVALASIAAWGREAGYIVVYVPSASIFMSGGFYLKNESNGMWSTPESARLLMRTVEAQHAQQLAEVADPAGGGSLADSMAAGINATDPHEVTEAAVHMLEVLKSQSQVPALFVVDDWNALYWPTMYFESPTRTNQRNVLPIELRLAVAVRNLMEGEAAANGATLVAMTRDKGISSRLVIPRPQHSTLKVSPFSHEETAMWIMRWAVNGMLPIGEEPQLTEQQQYAWFLTGGNTA
eukprot:CAMPEP_0206139160 /NCGR_PEP_ID=MMETSP1473-20131121/4879_1 /ASSEMBLY_ACC=CAM_ASM_001109 /TAXON_ID=1461547 /ORGANISM="Stichococcus sp, Strain RCC1054" /LENGTH=486 /DNA_ID=CAMNT_0053532819 /DNA_START=163 /DNA_END=1620 /DNA_ORIENTATION=-